MKTQNSTRDVVFLSGVRTPFGAFGGALKDLTATDLGVAAAKAAIERAGVQPPDVDHAIFGNVLQTSADAIYYARHIALRAGCPDGTPALTVNRLCGSGFQAIMNGAQEILLGDAELCLVGGGESMSQAPHVVRGIRFGTPFGKSPPMIDSLWEALRDPVPDLMMAETAEKLAKQYSLSRSAVDEYALRSQQLAKAAWDRGVYDDEVIGVPVRNPKTRQMEDFRRDEHMRPETTLDTLAKLKPVFDANGVVTAGNASGIGDGAAALVVSSADFAADRKLTPLARLVAWGVAGVDPSVMGLGPVPAARAALVRAGMKLDQMDLIEVNEAFAPQVCAVERELGIPRDRLNLDGGAIALSHPLGASGARIAAHLLHALKARGARYALGSACIGGGQGVALIIENLS